MGAPVGTTAARNAVPPICRGHIGRSNERPMATAATPVDVWFPAPCAGASWVCSSEKNLKAKSGGEIGGRRCSEIPTRFAFLSVHPAPRAGRLGLGLRVLFLPSWATGHGQAPGLLPQKVLHASTI